MPHTSHIIVGGVFILETFVIGKIDKKRAEQGDMAGIVDRLAPVGYDFSDGPGYYQFTKLGRVEAVITEIVPVCEDHGLDVEDFAMTEFRSSDGTERSRYEGGRIIRPE